MLTDQQLTDAAKDKYPDQYLHILECRSGEQWIMPLRGNASLDLTKQTKKWIRQEYCGELFLSGDMQPKLDGDYYAKIITDGRQPDCGIVWDGAGFWLSDEPSLFGRES